jgi:deoxyribodipyrimidine photo-lyase
MRTIVWFRGKDLRLADHAPLTAGAQAELLPVFVLDPYFFSPERAAELPRRISYLLESLRGLAENLEKLGSRLLLVRGRSVEVIPRLASALRADAVSAQRWTEPFGRERDARIAAELSKVGVKWQLHEGETLAAPGTLRTQKGSAFSVFTPFNRTLRAELEGSLPLPLPAPSRLPGWPPGTVEALEGSGLAWASGVEAVPRPEQLGLEEQLALPAGEAAARQRLHAFGTSGLPGYAVARDRLDLAATSRLSQDLKFGTLSVREVYQRVAACPGSGVHVERYLTELGWREFAHYLLWERPELLERPFRQEFERFPWVSNELHWQAWVQGKTGYPVVDAAARQLLTEGFVHNRARMIAASFLTKHLRIHYALGEAHYLTHLTDGDWASNNLGWQWSAGCGCDAQPYFRVFNPVLQGQRFDPEGAYVRRYVPELRRLPTRFLHQPWAASPLALGEAGIKLGVDYPLPIVEHAKARRAFLAAATRHLRAPP